MDLKPDSYHTSEDRVEEVVEVGLEGPYSQVFGEQRQLLADGLQEDNVLRVVLHLTCLSSQRQQLQHFLTGLWYCAQLCQQVQTPVTNITGNRATTSKSQIILTTDSNVPETVVFHFISSILTMTAYTDIIEAYISLSLRKLQLTLNMAAYKIYNSVPPCLFFISPVHSNRCEIK